MPTFGSSRRQLLLASGTLVAATLSGCSDLEGDDSNAGDEPQSDGGSTVTEDSADDTDSDGTATQEGEADSDGEDESTADEPADLDLREANVVDVTVEPTDETGAYRFDVTLHHDDDGEDGYANWWQVERRNGERLGRRELTHAHSQQPFTRSATIEIPEAASCVVVRGHDETHGYGGRAMLVAIESGETRVVDQGVEAQSVEETDCP
ncbi:MSCRAMM family adhesin SdrC [Halovivax cerinus]|uniref:MSCRAMM family adhesin SdrC n=1 Tax=Halovivax cerinus TaxID=1487865 RepID=A0ABD5NRK1_9EURY|nr:MSCRAMM family adhesin SdrC [Halovivax cerinus]